MLVKCQTYANINTHAHQFDFSCENAVQEDYAKLRYFELVIFVCNVDCGVSHNSFKPFKNLLAEERKVRIFFLKETLSNTAKILKLEYFWDFSKKKNLLLCRTVIKSHTD